MSQPKTRFERIVGIKSPKPLATKAARRAKAFVQVSALDLDEVCRTSSSFQTFSELVESTQAHGYTPTLHTTPRNSSVREFRIAFKAERIADAYDAAMLVLGLKARAFRGSTAKAKK